MAHVHFTHTLRRHVDCPALEVDATSVREALDAVFEERPEIRRYVLDDQGGLRRHVIVFVDGQQLSDRRQLSDAVSTDAEIYVMQALSGG